MQAVWPHLESRKILHSGSLTLAYVQNDAKCVALLKQEENLLGETDKETPRREAA